MCTVSFWWLFVVSGWFERVLNYVVERIRTTVRPGGDSIE